MINEINIRSSEKFVVIKNMFSNIQQIFNSMIEINIDTLQRHSSFYLKSLSLYEEYDDIAFLIFAIPGLVFRNQKSKIVEIYELIQKKICDEWDTYTPNSKYEDYIYLRLQDIRSLDGLIYMISEITYLDNNKKINILSINDNFYISEPVIYDFIEKENEIKQIIEFISNIGTSMNKLTSFINRIIKMTDDEDLQSFYSPNKETIQIIDKALYELEKLLDLVQSKNKSKESNKQSNDINDEVSISSNTEIYNLIKKIKELKSNDHMLILGLKYIVSNFNVTNKEMMSRVLKDSEYAKIIEIILNANNKS
ncbi:hypothetical protein IOLA_121 [uncultured bacterium]|nr:hypothetical protein IOLA_121 [uncultured bacterium]